VKGGQWDAQCRQRGPSLSHAHDEKCTEHSFDTCCHCGDRISNAPLPPLDVTQRLKLLGLGKSPNPGPPEPPEADGLNRDGSTGDNGELAPDCPSNHNLMSQWATCSDCKVVHEPDMKNSGPTGRRDDPGRGALTGRQQTRLLGYAGYEKWLDGRLEP
jgi:hypothetical protein